jgi:hypothetical protein
MSRCWGIGTRGRGWRSGGRFMKGWWSVRRRGVGESALAEARREGDARRGG